MRFKFKQLHEPIFTSEPWYDLTTGGYIKPSDLLIDPEQAKEVSEALQTVLTFLDEARNVNIIEYL